MEARKSDNFIFFVNGKKVEDCSVDPSFTLLRYLREKLLLPGTKYGCGEGGCGACTVMVSKFDNKIGKIRHFSINACLTPVCALHGFSVTTTEGIGSTKTRLHPVQERLAKAHGSQCGFCTAGFVMSMYTLLRNSPKPTMEEIEENIVGNLCRCTGYRPILEGFRTFTDGTGEMNGCGKTDCCMTRNKSSASKESDGENINGLNIQRTSVLFDSKMFAPYDPSQEVIFPPELKLHPELQSQSLVFKGPNQTFFRPATINELLSLKQTYPHAKIVIGNTEVGVEVKFKNQHYPVIIHPSSVRELTDIEVNDSCIKVGAAVTLAEIETAFKEIVAKLPDHKTQVIRSILEMLRWFAGMQIRNVASFGGNIMTGSPISDLNPIFMAAGSKLTFRTLAGERIVNFDEHFFTGYRRTVAEPNEVLMNVTIPFTSEDEFFNAYKQARRRDDDIAIVNAAMKVAIDVKTLKVKKSVLVFGGMAPVTKMATKTMQVIDGRVWNKTLLELGTQSLMDELRLDASAPGGMVDYRLALTASFLFKFYFSVYNTISMKNPGILSPLNDEEKELANTYRNMPAKHTQFFQNVPEDQEEIDPVGRPIPHVASLKQTTGEATYIDDIPHLQNELAAAWVLSTRAHAKILKIDESEALKLDGVEAFFCARDLPDTNMTGAIVKDNEVFASSEVRCVGQVVGLVVARDQSLAQKAAKLVKVSYEDIPNPIFTIEEAIKQNSMFDAFYSAERGNIEEGFKESDFILEGESYIGGQEHFYLETNVHLAIPHEGNELEVISSTQSVNDIQDVVSNALGIPKHFITCKVKRIGGAFGGKGDAAALASVPVAVAAFRLRRPVRIVLDRDEDMLATGGRHPFLGKWKVGFNKDGKLVALDSKLYCNGGYCLGLSGKVISKAIYSADSSYKIDHLNVNGYPCKTNLPSNTAFRGFGIPQVLFVMEDMIEKVSEYLKIDSKIVREMNMYNSGDVTHVGQELNNSNLRKCWNQAIESAEYEHRAKEVKQFNSQNQYKKRGLSLVPIKHGIGFLPAFLNQAGALVLVYKDGSVLISHSGMEMGQGVHTKMIQVASRALKIPAENIYIAETSTDKVPNATLSAASATTDLNGVAIMRACKEILCRLAPYKKKLPEKTWKDWVMAAYFDRVSLAVSEFNKMEYVCDVNPVTKKGNPFLYFTYGAAVSEVEIDCLTGDHTLLRTDIVMDIGTSLNPAIDIGQIEGSFVQGYGLFTIEQLVYSASGELLSRGPGAYKIPSVRDIPREFNVSLLRDPSSEPRAIYSAKASGEPPLFSASSVFFALREAVKAARGDPNEIFHFVAPATAERIRMKCKDHITDKLGVGRKSQWSLDI